jgi:hypothetical protein
MGRFDQEFWCNECGFRGTTGEVLAHRVEVGHAVGGTQLVPIYWKSLDTTSAGMGASAVAPDEPLDRMLVLFGARCPNCCTYFDYHQDVAYHRLHCRPDAAES